MTRLQDMAHQVHDVVHHVVSNAPLPSHSSPDPLKAATQRFFGGQGGRTDRDEDGDVKPLPSASSCMPSDPPALLTDVLRTPLLSPASHDDGAENPRLAEPPVVEHSLPSLSVESSGKGSVEILLAQRSRIRSTHSQAPRIDLTLKLLRGSEFPSEEELPENHHLTVQIIQKVRRIGSGGHEKETEDEVLLLGSTVVANREMEVWGGPSHSWNFQGSEDDQLYIKLFEDNPKSGMPTRELGHASVDTVELTDQRCRNPNRWITFEPSGDDGFDEHSILSVGKIQFRLTKQTTAIIQEQENCEKISAGPALPSFLTTFKVRKLALWSAAPVMLNIYDVSNNTRIENVNDYIMAVGVGGIFHAAIEVYGREFSFGGTRNRNSKISGIFPALPKQCPMHHYRETIYLGDCELTQVQVKGILKDLQPQWLASSYNLFRKNCCFFSRELAIQLGVGDIPEWVYCLAQSAEWIEPYLIKMDKRWMERAEAEANTNSKKASTAELHGPVQKKAAMTPPDHVENIVDHAMAAKIQRTFRRRSMVNGNSALHSRMT